VDKALDYDSLVRKSFTFRLSSSMCVPFVGLLGEGSRAHLQLAYLLLGRPGILLNSLHACMKIYHVSFIIVSEG